MRIPKHIAIIPDGNRRWAQAQGYPKQDGYQFGLDPGVECLRLARAHGVQELTFYGFTTDNCKRPRQEVQAFQQACVDAIERIRGEGAALLVVGNTASAMFPPALLPYTRERVAFGDGAVKVNFLVNYGWEWDLGQMQTTSADRKKICENLRSRDISRVDLVMRWGDRKRLSGLLPVQTVYADIYTVDALWPAFAPAQFEQALAWYDRQDVTLGG